MVGMKLRFRRIKIRFISELSELIEKKSALTSVEYRLETDGLVQIYNETKGDLLERNVGIVTLLKT